jgi:competence protein ComEC
MLIAPIIQHYFWGEDAQLGAIRRIVIETLSAQLATLPLIAWVFGSYSVLSLPANVLILPLVPLAMALTFAAGVGALTISPLAGMFGVPATAVLAYMTTVTDKLAAIPWASADVYVGTGLMIVGYAAIIGAGLYLWRATNHRFSKDNIVV